MVTWVLEDKVFSEKCFDEMIEHFKATAIPYHVVRVIPFIHEIEGKVPQIEGPVVVYGSIGAQKLAERHHWSPGVWTGDQFSYENYRDQLGDLLLNPDAIRMLLSEVKNYVAKNGDDHEFFIKPNGDLKEFAGQTMLGAEFLPWLDKMCSIGYLTSNDFDVVVSSSKKLGCEWRVVVVDGKISSASLYRQYQMVKPQRHILPEVEQLVKQAHECFVPAPVYVIDIAQFGNEFKVVEYNTFNSAGFYDCDVGKVIDDVNAYLEGNAS